jgi:hypothetical protein
MADMDSSSRNLAMVVARQMEQVAQLEPGETLAYLRQFALVLPGILAYLRQ